MPTRTFRSDLVKEVLAVLEIEGLCSRKTGKLMALWLGAEPIGDVYCTRHLKMAFTAKAATGNDQTHLWVVPTQQRVSVDTRVMVLALKPLRGLAIVVNKACVSECKLRLASVR